jgi:hypothetical protein
MRAARSASLITILIAACGGSGKPFDQMTAQEHRVAAVREHDKADAAFSRVRVENIEPPETFPGDVFYFGYSEGVGGYAYGYDSSDADAYIAWPRVSDPSEHDEDSASKHRERALRHERAAAALEGRPSPQPLPPPRPSFTHPDEG